MVDIKKQLVTESVANKRSYGKGNKKRYIVVHQTGNTTRGANAQAHANLQSRLNTRNASWHIQTDSNGAIQSFDYGYNCWHAGVGRAVGNLDSIGIEACINSDGDYLKTLEITAQVVKQLMDQFNIPIENVTQHNKWDGKNCPAQIRAGKDGITWAKFLAMVQKDNRKVEVTLSSNDLYRVQVGAFANKENAERLAKELKDKGYPVFIPNSNDTPAIKQSAPQPAPAAPRPLRAGDRVRLNTSASRYATGESIPASRKGKTYTVQQTRSGQVLLKEIVSWAHNKDVTRI